MIFHAQKNPNYEEVYRTETAGSGKFNSVIAKLLSEKFICKELLYMHQIILQEKIKNFPVFLLVLF